MGHVSIDMHGPVALLTLDAPPMNPLDRAMVARLGERVAQCARDARVRAVVLRGAGLRSFSVGSDLAELAGIVAQGREAIEEKFAQDEAVFGALAGLGKPTLAAIEGTAVGGGLELAVCCDLVLVGRSARLALPEILLGAFPGSGGTLRITRRVGPGRARRMMLLGDPVGVEESLAWGLVDHVVDDGRAVDEALALATRLAGGPALAIAACKAAIDAALDQPPSQALAFSRERAVELAFSTDLREGLDAFLGRRRPRFGASEAE